MRKSALLLFILPFLFACSSTDKRPGYYDVKDAVMDLSVELGLTERVIQKEAQLDGEKTSIELDLYNKTWIDAYLLERWDFNTPVARWYGELKILEEVNPNLPKYKDRFEIEEGTSPEGNAFFHYTPKSESLDIRDLYIETAGEEIIKLKARIEHDNVLAKNHRVYDFDKSGHFSISGQQNIIFLPEHNFAINISF